MINYLKNILFSLCFLFAGFTLAAQEVINVDNQFYKNYFSNQVFIFQDSSKSLSFLELQNLPHLFKPNKTQEINFGISDNYNWVKFNIVNNSQYNKLVLNIENPTIDNVSFFVLYNDKRIDINNTLEAMPINKRQYKNQFYLYDINLNKGDSATCYIRIYSPKEIIVPITIGGEDQILHQISNFDLLSGLYYGIMLVMLLYNLFIFITVRDKSYLFYVIYIFWVTITQATLQGYSHRFLWTDNVWLTNNMFYITAAMSGIATVFFTKSFLHSKVNIPKLDPYLNLIIAGDILAIVFLFCGKPSYSYNTININAGLGSLFVIYCAARLFNKFRQAKFFLVSYSVFLSCVIVFVIKDYGILPYNVYTSRSLQLGSAIEAILLSFALADQINIFRSEKEASQAEALKALKENERIIREQNVLLENKVNERTFELKIANTDLNAAMIELKEAQSQLVESEKMASLGQLTAGIAHEINNPINFVTSNVKPLKRDVQILVDAVDTIEKMVFDNSSIIDKQKNIEELKNDIDYDYLKIEIDQLLNGISEGANRTAEIVKGLRIFSRLDEDDLKKADINEGIDSTLVIANNLLENNIQVEKKYSNLPFVECYPGKLNQVFLNVISNAVYAIKKKFGSNTGGIISINTKCDDNHVFISIADNGTGMDELTKKKLFEPFFTTKDVGEGTGLGLSIAYNTINKHNGQIIVNSEVGVGTEFIIKLPLIQK